MRHFTALILALVAVAALHAQKVPHQGNGMPYDDELYRHLIYNEFDDPGVYRQSWVLPYTNPRFYIRLGSATECNHAWRVTWREFHFWRAIIPIVAEQLTGVPYNERVEVGCANREREYGWVIVNYVTPEEYEAETGEDWGNAWGRAWLGSTYGKIWLRYDGRPLRAPTSNVQDIIIHELGHAFGLWHTYRAGYAMRAGDYQPNTLALFTGQEERAARAAYRVGRGSYYCGDPDRCGNGFAPGYLPQVRGEAVIVAD